MMSWDAWIGRTETRHDRVDAGAAARWLAMLDRDPPADGVVPQGFHWCLCLPDAATAALGADGHPRRDDAPDAFLPPVPLPRRMWASSRVRFDRPLQIGQAIVRTSRIERIAQKQGGSGPLVFVDVAHDTFADGERAIGETQSLVFREAPAPGAAPVPPASDRATFDASAWDRHRVMTPSTPLLFRYSALTFNSHRIHYDLPYATTQEGYRGLVVHGPLTATLLLELARDVLDGEPLTAFDFRGLSPAIAGEPLHLVARGVDDRLDMAAFAADGRQVTAATAWRGAPAPERTAAED